MPSSSVSMRLGYDLLLIIGHIIPYVLESVGLDVFHDNNPATNRFTDIVFIHFRGGDGCSGFWVELGS